MRGIQTRQPSVGCLAAKAAASLISHPSIAPWGRSNDIEKSRRDRCRFDACDCEGMPLSKVETGVIGTTTDRQSHHVGGGHNAGAIRVGRGLGNVAIDRGEIRHSRFAAVADNENRPAGSSPMIRSSPGLPNMESLLIEPNNVSVPLRPNNASALSDIQGIITCPPPTRRFLFLLSYSRSSSSELLRLLATLPPKCRSLSPPPTRETSPDAPSIASWLASPSKVSLPSSPNNSLVPPTPLNWPLPLPPNRPS